jgi:ferritin-like metal-binding protein YciE
MADFTLRDLYQSELHDLYGAERRIIDALPTIIPETTSAVLRDSLERHLERTRVHVERLDLLLKQAGQTTSANESNPAIDGLIKAGEMSIRKSEQPHVRDAALIAAAQHVEHYEMAGYGCARTHARQLDDDAAADLLQQTLDEEGDADKELTRIAESGLNQAANDGEVAQAPSPARLRYVDAHDVGGEYDYTELRIRNRANDNLGHVEGFVVDAAGRPYYLVVDSGGWFIGRRYLLPVGKADLRRDDRTLVVDIDEDTFKRYPEFHRNAFLAMSDEEARRYEWRVLEAIDPTAARRAPRDWDYERMPYYQRPQWLASSVWRAPESRTVRTDRAPIGKRTPTSSAPQERERVVARETETPGSRETVHDEVRGKTDEKIR